MHLYSRIKKYLFLLACIFSVATAAHIVMLYLYEGAETVPEKGGTLTIGMIGSAPSVNPTQYRLDTGNDFVLRFLYRGLIKYNLDTGSMEGDLANCDLSKSYAEVRCYFKPGSVWSTGEKITQEDVLSTYSLLAETDVNKKLQASLSKLAITQENGAIVFRSSTPSSELIQLLSTPILKKSVTEKFRDGTIKPEDNVYSGPYSFEKHETDALRQVDRISLVRNDIPWDDAGYSRFVIRFYSDSDSLLAQKDSLNFIYPDKSLGDLDSSRLVTDKFLTPDFIAAFANTERLSLGLRQLVLQIATKVRPAENDPDSYAVKNPFFTEASVVNAGSGSIDAQFEALGYYKKSVLMASFSGQTAAVQTPAPAANTGTVTPPPQPTTTPTVPRVAQNKYFTSPSKDAAYVTEPRAEIVLSGNVPAWVDAVYIGGYRLKSFGTGDKTFTYRARTDIGNLREGTNTYTLSFEKAGTKTTEETMTIYVISDAAAREAKKKELFGTPEEAKPVPVQPTPAPTTNSGATVVPTTPKFADLDDRYRYNKDGKRLSLVLRSLNLTPEVADTSKKIADALEAAGIETKVEAIDSDPEAISDTTKNGNKSYDLLVTGVNLGFLGTYVFPYFHSGQSESGYNFSKLKNPNLDILLEDLKGRDMPKESRIRTEEHINDLLRKEAVIAPISSSYIEYYVDKGMKDIHQANILPSGTFLSDVIRPSHIKEAHIIKTETKSVSGFFIWFISHAREILGATSP